jgi:hypothetical protein
MHLRIHPCLLCQRMKCREKYHRDMWDFSAYKRSRVYSLKPSVFPPLLSCVPRDALRRNHGIYPWRDVNMPFGALGGQTRRFGELPGSTLEFLPSLGCWVQGTRLPKVVIPHPCQWVHQAINCLVSPCPPFAVRCSEWVILHPPLRRILLQLVTCSQ